MAQQPKSILRNQFLTGKRPKQQDFHDWLDSYYHKTDDPIKITGWTFRSFLKELRAEGSAITNGGASMVDIPISATVLKGIRVFGNGTKPANVGFTVTVSLLFFSDKQIAALNGVPNDIPQIPIGAGFFRHALIGNLTAPSFTFIITVAPSVPTEAPFDATLDLTAKNFNLDFTTVRFFRLTIAATTNITFQPVTNNSCYYGLQYE